MPRYPKGMEIHTLPGAYHSGRATKAQLEFTLNKLLKGAGDGADPTEIDVSALSSKLLSHTRDMEAASGDVAYTGYGFQPRAIIIFAQAPTAGAAISSWGFGDVALAEMCLWTTGSTGVFAPSIATNLIVKLTQTSGVTEQIAVLKTLDADGFTLTWTKVGTPATATATLIVLALR